MRVLSIKRDPTTFEKSISLDEILAQSAQFFPFTDTVGTHSTLESHLLGILS